MTVYERSSFKHRDRVTATGGPHKGQSGTVTHVDSAAGTTLLWVRHDSQAAPRLYQPSALAPIQRIPLPTCSRCQKVALRKVGVWCLACFDCWVAIGETAKTFTPQSPSTGDTP